MYLIWQNKAVRTHVEVLTKTLEPLNAEIIDVGCGAGHITRALSNMGAKVIGLDPGKRQLERARAEKPAGNEVYIEGIAEDLPFDDHSRDIILFFNSFHHIPESKFFDATRESHRVLRPRGKLFFAEPIADGPQFELSRLINDESEIRALAYQTILDIPNNGFQEILELTYITENRYKNFESFRFNSISINPAREKIFDEYETEIRGRFEKHSTKNQGYFIFQNPIRVNLFERDSNSTK